MNRVEDQSSFCEGSGLVHAQYVYACQSLDSGEFLDQYVVFSQPESAHGEGHARQQH
ncbi:hypothetical protein SRABI128_05988 [Microbacterium sp. Bi128]|nr:hypothetical protein SRABI128_05988 [Microbacterium sp. Bi128]